jgi:hypothetical protein
MSNIIKIIQEGKLYKIKKALKDNIKEKNKDLDNFKIGDYKGKLGAGIMGAGIWSGGYFTARKLQKLKEKYHE